jgi:hypothetical protein
MLHKLSSMRFSELISDTEKFVPEFSKINISRSVRNSYGLVKWTGG